MCGIETIDNLDRRCTRFMYPSFPPKRDLGPPGGRERVVGTSSQPACCFKLQRIKAASRPVLPVAYTQPNLPSSPGCQGGKQILPEPDKCPNNNMGQHPGRSFLAAASRRSALRNEKRVPRGTKFREDYLRAAGPCLSPPRLRGTSVWFLSCRPSHWLEMALCRPRLLACPPPVGRFPWLSSSVWSLSVALPVGSRAASSSPFRRWPLSPAPLFLRGPCSCAFRPPRPLSVLRLQEDVHGCRPSCRRDWLSHLPFPHRPPACPGFSIFPPTSPAIPRQASRPPPSASSRSAPQALPALRASPPVLGCRRDPSRAPSIRA